MSLTFSASGRDDVATFVVTVPGHCQACSKDTDVVMRYHASQASAALKRRGVDIKKTPSLIITVNEKITVIGVTCGCYAKFHRQIAHISTKGRNPGKGSQPD